MATNLIADGSTVDWENDTAEDVQSGDLVVLNDLVGIAHGRILPGMHGVLHTVGVWELPKAAGALALGQTVAVDNGQIKAAADGLVVAGRVWRVADDADETVWVRLNV